MDNKKIIITGGAGFLGKYLVDLFINKGFKNIVVIDKFNTKIDGVNYIQTDFSDEQVVKPILKECDTLIHLAATIGVDNCRNHPDLVKQVNLINTKKLFEWGVKAGIRRIIFTSSSEVYGNSKDIPYEENGKLEPISVYGEAKVEVEEYLRKIQQSSNTTIGISRLFNVYGPGQKKDFVASIFINAALDNKPLQIFGSGEQTRTFTYVEDAAEGIFRVYKYNITPFEIVNLGGQQEYSITQLAEMVLSLLPESISKIEYLRYGQEETRTSNFEIDRRIPSIDKAKRLLDFRAETTLREGLSKTIHYFQEQQINYTNTNG